MIQFCINCLRKICGTLGSSDKIDQMLIETRIAAGFSRGAATAAVRRLDPANPRTWEFGAFSQHGEDGILDYLICGLVRSNRFFVEIAAADGLENCTAWLALAGKWSGVMVEGDEHLAALSRRTYQNRVWNVNVVNDFVTVENISEILGRSPYKDFDVLSLDIDSVDFHILKATLNLGYKPKIIAVEYNSVFGPEVAVTVPYKDVFNRWTEHETGIYYGASLGAWKLLLGRHGYRFITVDSSGTNAFFVDESCFKPGYLEAVQGTEFLNNATDINPTVAIRDGDGHIVRMLEPEWRRQINIISHLPLETIN
ncbi:hypothetical protein EI77_02519 [Prosthecobacter fusiformis]|uniref:FkbM family methyltransferase n=1 Tax=Prosthecobacter fusiformis TaxID=48464 RepID=A0A4R7S2B5_9BACT|nr:hypothetical protein [Prosthecobacter fusiformis]TDU71395.1 hypothetical protein EI77_02519 [Prosthecobacter fusiformis]